MVHYIKGVSLHLLHQFSFSYSIHSFIKVNILPLDWKSVKTIPMFKKGSHTDPSNISKMCIFCRIFKHIISSAISSHANLHIICNKQHEFSIEFH